MWQCDNCGYTDEDTSKFEEETEEGLEDAVRYCPECGSDEVFQVDEDEPGPDLFDEDDDDDDDLGDDDDEDGNDWDDDESADGW